MLTIPGALFLPAQVLLRLRPCDGSWGWTYPVSFNPIGELPMLFRQIEFPDVYVARLQISKTSWGARVLIIKPEDLEHPPFVVHNACESKYIVSFRQVWVLRPGPDA